MQASAADWAVRVDGIVKQFGNHLAVDHVTFAVPRGAVYGVLGPNGAGKSTTLRMINDILVPDEGSITLLGSLRPGRAANERIGYLPEERGLYPKMKVLDMVTFMGELRQLPRQVARQRGAAWLERLGLRQWTDNKVQDLSKGMQQKVQFATALIHEPELVILDEPWSGLDPINAEVLKSTVEELRQAGRTVLFSTHQMEQAEKVCDEVCIIARGKVLKAGKVAALKAEAAAGERVVLRFASPDDGARAVDVLADRALVSASQAHADGSLEVRPVSGQSAQALLARLVAAEVRLLKFEVMAPSLHEIFVATVGEAESRQAARREEMVAS